MRALPFLVLITASPLQAQWSTSFTITRSASEGHARDNIGTELRPDGPMTAALGVAIGSGAWRVRIAARYAEAGLAVASEGAALITPQAMHAWGTSLEAGRRIAGDDGTAPTLRASLGAELAQWRFAGADEEARWRPAVVGALEGAVRLANRWRMLVRGEVAIGPSLFDASELPDGYGLRRALRHGVGFGIERIL